MAVIIQDGLRRMLAEQEDVYYYITLMNENYVHPAMPPDARDGILRGMYLLRPSTSRDRLRRKRHASSYSDPARYCAKFSPAPICSPTSGA